MGTAAQLCLILSLPALIIRVSIQLCDTTVGHLYHRKKKTPILPAFFLAWPYPSKEALLSSCQICWYSFFFFSSLSNALLLLDWALSEQYEKGGPITLCFQYDIFSLCEFSFSKLESLTMQVTNIWMYVFPSKFELDKFTWGQKGKREIHVQLYNCCI